MIRTEKIILFVSVMLATFPGFIQRWVGKKSSWQCCSALTDGLLATLGILKHFWEAEAHRYFTVIPQSTHFYWPKRTAVLFTWHLLK